MSYLLGVKNGVLVPIKVFSLKRSIPGVFAVPFRVLSRKKNVTGDNVFCSNCNLLGVKKNFEPRLQNRFLIPLLLVVLFRISDQHPCPFYMRVHPPPPGLRPQCDCNRSRSCSTLIPGSLSPLPLLSCEE